MNIAEKKSALVKDAQELVQAIQQAQQRLLMIQGAIALCNQLESEETDGGSDIPGGDNGDPRGNTEP